MQIIKLGKSIKFPPNKTAIAEPLWALFGPYKGEQPARLLIAKSK